jgi:hypothetical protein
MRDYRGDFEVHLTVRAAGAAPLDRFRAWCRERDFKCIHIVLARGDNPDQPMASWRRRATTLPEVLRDAQQHAAELGGLAVLVVRLKVEAAPHNDEVPAHDADAAGHAPENYFEHHTKLLRATAAPAADLAQTCERFGAHLSLNAFRQAAPGQEERFVTLRCYAVGRDTAGPRFGQLLAALTELGEQVIGQESEYCVYDSNLGIDAGWLPRPA